MIRSARNVVIPVTLMILFSLYGSLPKLYTQLALSDIATNSSVSLGFVSLGPALFSLSLGILGILVGSLVDSKGPKLAFVIGCCAIFLFFAIILATNKLLFYVAAYPTFAALGTACLSFVTIAAYLNATIPQGLRDTAFALASNGPALSYMLVAPAFTALSSRYGWDEVVLICSIMGSILVLVALGLGNHRQIHSGEGDSPLLISPSDLHGSIVDRKKALKSAFIPIIAFMVCGATMSFVDVQYIIGMKSIHGMEHSYAPSLSLILLGLFEIIGSAIAGRACDNGHAAKILTIAYAIRGMSFIFLFFSPELGNISAYFFAIIFGVSYLMTVIATTSIVTILARGHAGFCLGIMWALHSASAALSAWAGTLAIENKNIMVTGLSIILAAFCFLASLSISVKQIKSNPSEVNM